MNPRWLKEIEERVKWCNNNWCEFMNNKFDGECESALRVAHEDRDALLYYVRDLKEEIKELEGTLRAYRKMINSRENQRKIAAAESMGEDTDESSNNEE